MKLIIIELTYGSVHVLRICNIMHVHIVPYKGATIWLSPKVNRGEANQEVMH